MTDVRGCAPHVIAGGSHESAIWRSGITVGGTEHAGRVGDLSAGGAFVRGVASLPVGTRGTLRLDGVAAALGCEVRAAEQEGVQRRAA
ncbi:MAG TPA: PilZ domain-containing protein [Acetobacteraceae bacterium]|nr:PilZ domain-containing protein [Acetobacteraceae bacterium]